MNDESELLAAIRRDPDSIELYLVLADLLQARGDPRGELIAIQAALAAAPDEATLRDRERVLLATHAEVLVGDVPAAHAALGDQAVQLTWRHGFIDRVRIVAEGKTDKVGKLLRVLFACPSAALLRSLYLQITMRDPERVIATLVKACPPTLRELRILSREASVGVLTPLWQRLPHLRHVKIGNWAGFDLGNLELDELESLDLVGATDRELAEILLRPRPALRRLHVDLKSPTPKIAYKLFDRIPGLRDLGFQTNDGPVELETYVDRGITALSIEPAGVTTLDAIVAARPGLRSLRLRGGGLDAKTAGAREILGGTMPELRDLFLPVSVATLAGSRVLPRLATLALTNVTLRDLEDLVAHAAAFAHLSRITLVRPLSFDRTRDAQAYDAAKTALPLVDAESDRVVSGDLPWA